MTTKHSYQAKFFLSDTGKIVHLTDEFHDLKEFHKELCDNADHIGSLFNDYDFFASYLGDEEYEPGREYNEEECRYDFNLQTLNEWIEELIRTGSLSTVVTDAEIIERTYDEPTSVYFQAEVLDSDDDALIDDSASYSKIEAVYDELRDRIDVIGRCIAESIDECSYLGDVDYENGREFNDHKEEWSFNKKTLNRWIETAISVGNYNGPIVNIRIIKKEILDKYIPEYFYLKSTS